MNEIAIRIPACNCDDPSTCGCGTQGEPWWVAGDREVLECMRNAIKAKPETAMVRYLGDQRPMLVSEVRAKMAALQKRIAADIAEYRANQT